MTEQRPPGSSGPPDAWADRLLDVVLFAPIGVLAAVRDDLAKFSALGRREVDLARFIGRFAAQQGQKVAQDRLTAWQTACTARRAPAPAAAPAAEPEAAAPEPDPAPASPAGAAPDADAGADLPIEAYDSLAASHVIARLAALDDAELARVEAYERAHRGRRTVLGKIAQLRSNP